MTTNDEMTDGAGETATATENPLQQERDELQDRLLRTAAEFDNYRKRTDRERRELHDFITSDLMREMLPGPSRRLPAHRPHRRPTANAGLLRDT